MHKITKKKVQQNTKRLQTATHALKLILNPKRLQTSRRIFLFCRQKRKAAFEFFSSSEMLIFSQDSQISYISIM